MCVFIKIGTHFLAQGGFELLALPPQPPESEMTVWATSPTRIYFLIFGNNACS